MAAQYLSHLHSLFSGLGKLTLGDSRIRRLIMRNVIPFPAHNTTFAVEPGSIDGQVDGPGCACIACRPHGALLSFMPSDSHGAAGGRTTQLYNRQRLNHQFTAVKSAPAAWVPAPKVEKLMFHKTSATR